MLQQCIWRKIWFGLKKYEWSKWYYCLKDNWNHNPYSLFQKHVLHHLECFIGWLWYITLSFDIYLRSTGYIFSVGYGFGVTWWYISNDKRSLGRINHWETSLEHEMRRPRASKKHITRLIQFILNCWLSFYYIEHFTSAIFGGHVSFHMICAQYTGVKEESYNNIVLASHFVIYFEILSLIHDYEKNQESSKCDGNFKVVFSMNSLFLFGLLS